MSRARKRTGGARVAGVALLALLAVGALAATWLARSKTAPASPPARPASAAPNVVIYLIDTLRADHLSIYGYPQPTCPNLEALAAESVVFENALATSPWTLPTIVSLMTSTYPCEHGVLVDGQRPSESLKTLAERMKTLGYTTLSFYANAYAGPASGLDRGFDRCRRDTRDDPQKVQHTLDNFPTPPYFIYIHQIQPHDPYRFAPLDRLTHIPAKKRARFMQLHKNYQRLTRADFSKKQPLGMTDNSDEQREALARLLKNRAEYTELYDASIKEADRELGELIETLKARKLWDDTLLILTADHGEELGDHGGWSHDQSMYQELTHVPLLMRFPRGEFGGRRVEPPACTVDVLPTIFDYLQKAPLAAGARGESLMPAIRGVPAPAGMRVVGLRHNRKKYYRPWKQQRGDVNVVVRDADWKAIWNVEPDRVELYDLHADPAEQADLSAAQPERAQAMRDFASAWMESCGALQQAPSGDMDQLDEQTIQQLRALGYVD